MKINKPAASYLPGVGKCHTCGLIIFDDMEILTKPCPNDGDTLFPMTWQESLSLITSALSLSLK